MVLDVQGQGRREQNTSASTSQRSSLVVSSDGPGTHASLLPGSVFPWTPPTLERLPYSRIRLLAIDVFRQLEVDRKVWLRHHRVCRAFDERVDGREGRPWPGCYGGVEHGWDGVRPRRHVSLRRYIHPSQPTRPPGQAAGSAAGLHLLPRSIDLYGGI